MTTPTLKGLSPEQRLMAMLLECQIAALSDAQQRIGNPDEAAQAHGRIGHMIEERQASLQQLLRLAGPVEIAA